MASSTSSPYTAGPGPGFDPEKPIDVAPAQEEGDRQRAGAAPPAGAGEAFAEEWDEQKLRTWLANIGDGLHGAFGVTEQDWKMSQRDLERIAPPLARVLNRYEPTKAIAEYSDPAAVALGVGMYTYRSMILERMAAKRAAEQAERESGSIAFEGPNAPPGPIDIDTAPNGAGPDVAAGYTTFADQLRATRPPEEPQQ